MLGDSPSGKIFKVSMTLTMGSTRVRIAIDAMGGDHAPAEIVAGAIRAQHELGVDVLLVGDPEQIRDQLQQQATEGDSSVLSQMEIVPAEGVVEMHEEPLSALKRKPKASIGVAMDLVKQNRAQGVVSAGHSGAAMAAAVVRLGRLPGLDRPAIGAVLPTLIPGKSVLVLDVGANVDCRPKFLEQFALMGTIYAQHALGIAAPQVGLLNIGEEATKGNDQTVRAYQMLQENPHISFMGNAEGRDVLKGQFDVVVCDGFVGNVLLKFAESVGEVIMQMLKAEFADAMKNPTEAAVLGPRLKRIRQQLDHVEHGGALLLGVGGICIISHGSSQAPSIFNAVRLAKEAIENQVLENMLSVQAKIVANQESVVSTTSNS